MWRILKFLSFKYFTAERKCASRINIRSVVDKALVFVRSASLSRPRFVPPGQLPILRKAPVILCIKFIRLYFDRLWRHTCLGNYFVIANAASSSSLSHTLREEGKMLFSIVQKIQCFPSASLRQRDWKLMCEILSLMIYHTLKEKFRTKDRSRLIGSLFCRELMRNTLPSVQVV